MRINGERTASAEDDDERPNTPAQGLPTISGEPHVMMELTASTSGITDADGLSGASYSYQWIRVDESTGVAVESEIERPWWRYELLVSPEFEGSKFKVQVSFTDDRGNSETLTSVATAQARDLYPPTNFDAVWTSQSEAVLTWQPPDIDRGEPILRYKYCYGHSDGSNAWVCKHTEGAPLTVTVGGLVYTGVRWQFNISAFDGMGSGMGRGTVPLPPSASLPPKVGVPSAPTVLTTKLRPDGRVRLYAWGRPADIAITEIIRYEYRFAEGHSVPEAAAWTWDLHLGAAGATFRVDPGQTYSFEVRAVNSVGAGVAALSRTATGVPEITGTARVGETLSVSTSGMTDADGLSGASYRIRWYREDESPTDDFFPLPDRIESATGSAYTPVEADIGRKLLVMVDFTDDSGNIEVVFSASTSAVSRASASLPPKVGAPSAPTVLTTKLRPDGRVRLYAWGRPADIAITEIIRYEYRFAEGHSVPEAAAWTWDLHLGAAGATFRVDPGQTYSFEVRAVNSVGAGVAALSRTATGVPEITGTARVGETLSVSTSGMTDADGLSGASYRIRWYREDESPTDDFFPLPDRIESATGSAYTPVEADIGRKLLVMVDFTDDSGNIEVVFSASTSAVSRAAAQATQAVAFTAQLAGLPERHDGAGGFSFELHFSENAPDLSYKTLRDSAFRVTNGLVTGVRRLEPGKNQRWRVTVRPAGTEDVQIALPITTDCRAAGAICSGGRPLSTPLAAMVLGPPAAPPLTAEFRSMPAEHDGRTPFSFELHFSEDVPGLSYRTLRDGAFTVTGARVTGARRLAQGSNRGWAVSAQPSAPETVTVRLPATADCAGAGAICLPDGRKLSGALAATVLGPPAARVADARAEEGTDDTLDFVVTLSRATNKAVTVGYATSDGTATAGADYTQSTGTLTFAPGETVKTVPVPVLDDAIDEGEETMRLTLSSPSGVKLGDAEAVGTISNSDPLQKMWLSRFGRAAAGHVVEAVSARLSGPLAGAQVTVGGQRIDLARISDGEGVAEAIAGLARALGAGGGPRPEAGPDGWPETRSAWDYPASAGASARSLSGRELLLGSAFHLSHDGGGGGPGLAAWGRVTTGGFDAEAPAERGRMRIDGEVTTGIVGADAAWNRWLAGVAVSVSAGEGRFEQPGVDSGTVESRLTSVQPYARLQMSERLSAWGLVGYGSGDMTITEAANGERLETVTRTDIEMRLGAVGVRGALLEAGEAGGVDLALKADAFLVRMESEKAANTAATTADASRLRLTLEGSRAFELGEGSTLTPGLELGLRHDGGAAETGTGVELGGRIRYADTASGLSVEASARTLIAHQASGFEEWGASGSIRLDPGASGRGLSFTLAPTFGAASSGTERLWSMADARDLAAGEGFEPEARLNAEVGYGLGLGGGLFTGTPYAGLGLSESGREWRLGWRLGSARREALDFALDIQGTRSESAGGDAPPEHGLMLRGALRW